MWTYWLWSLSTLILLNSDPLHVPECAHLIAPVIKTEHIWTDWWRSSTLQTRVTTDWSEQFITGPDLCFFPCVCCDWQLSECPQTLECGENKDQTLLQSRAEAASWPWQTSKLSFSRQWCQVVQISPLNHCLWREDTVQCSWGNRASVCGDIDQRFWLLCYQFTGLWCLIHAHKKKQLLSSLNIWDSAAIQCHVSVLHSSNVIFMRTPPKFSTAVSSIKKIIRVNSCKESLLQRLTLSAATGKCIFSLL